MGLWRLLWKGLWRPLWRPLWRLLWKGLWRLLWKGLWRPLYSFIDILLISQYVTHFPITIYLIKHI